MHEPDDLNGLNAVDSYGAGFFRIGGTLHHGPVVVEGDRVQPWQGLEDTAPLRALQGRVDVLFLGLGEHMAYPPRDLLGLLDSLGIRVEATASPTAARSYNMTLSEGRRVACALLPL